MKKWIIVVGLFGCSVLFFISGSFVGYLLSETKDNVTTQVKPKRAPSGKLEPILGRIVEIQKVELINKTRVPTPNAIYKAQQYKAQFIGSS